MERVVYVRVATKEQLCTEQEQVQLIKEEMESQNRIVTTVLFNDGTHRELSDDEIRSIFNGFLRGEKYFAIQKPKKEFDYIGKIKPVEVK